MSKLHAGRLFTKMSCDAEGVKASSRGARRGHTDLHDAARRPTSRVQRRKRTEIELVDEAGVPVPRERYRVTAPEASGARDF
jgi:hypothetical protein